MVDENEFHAFKQYVRSIAIALVVLAVVLIILSTLSIIMLYSNSREFLFAVQITQIFVSMTFLILLLVLFTEGERNRWKGSKK